MAKEGKNLVIIPEGTNTSNVATSLCAIDTKASPYQAATGSTIQAMPTLYYQITIINKT